MAAMLTSTVLPGGLQAAIARASGRIRLAWHRRENTFDMGAPWLGSGGTWLAGQRGGRRRGSDVLSAQACAQQKHFQVQPYFEYSFQLTDNFLHDEPICDDDGNVIDHYKDRVIKFTLNIKNIGGTSRNLFIKHRKDQPYLQQTQYKLEHAEIMTILFDVDGQMAQELNDGIEDLTRTFRIRYQDIYGKQYENYIACDVITYIDDETGQVYLQPNLKILSQSQALNHTV